MTALIAPPARAVADAPERPLPPMPPHWRSLARAFVHRARLAPGRPAVVDSTGQALTRGEVFLRAAALGRVLARTLGAEANVGVMVPPTVTAVLANVALALRGKVAVNLNYTAGQELVDSSVEQAGIRHVLTSRKVLDKFKIRPKGELVLLEDMPKQVTTADKIWAAAVAKAVPIAALGAFLPGLRGDHPGQTATIIFTSGSTGDPKGVVLSHGNVLGNIHQFKSQVDLTDDEVVLGVLPFFHSYGFNVPLWAVLSLGFKGVYHFSPLDARIVGNLCQEHAATLLLGTPTFARGYAARCEKAQFAAMRLLILGAERLKPELAAEIREKMGVEPMQGYGCTELSPVVAVNAPNQVTTADGRRIIGNRPGTVGMPLPGTMIRTTDAETGEVLARGEEGVVHVKGPQVMQGYLNRPEATAVAVVDGWYNTGDLGRLDADGFLTITGRLSRFSKIGGEMVPHEKVEAAIAEAAGAPDHALAVTSVPDAKRGERLVVVHTPLGVEASEIVRRLGAGPLPKLWLPSAESFLAVDALPILGTGKLDLRGLRTLAAERLGAG